MARSRARNGRFTAERTTTTSVTERVTFEDAADPTPVFTHLVNNPPPGARWAHPGFWLRPQLPGTPPAAAAFVVPFDDTAPVPVIKVPVARTYRELEPDSLDSAFTERDRQRLLALDGGA